MRSLAALASVSTKGEVLDFIKGLFDEKTLPVTSAVVAVLVSIWAAALSRKSMKASERSAAAAEVQVKHAAIQADAAERQAVAAMDQANSASSDAATAYQAAQISALEGARARIDAASPKVSVLMFKQIESAGIAENCYNLPAPITFLPKSDPVQLDHWTHWHWDAFFVSHGLLYNFGTEPVRVVSADVRFYEGVHPFTGENILNPPKAINDIAILYPGQHALFQVLARKQVDDWVNILEENDGEKECCDSYIWLFPAARDDPEMGVKIRTQGIPLRRRPPDDVYAIFKSASHFSVHVEFLRKYPKSTEEISADLREDREELFWIAVRNERKKSLRELMKKPEENAADD
ncbi:hypothetical protein ACWD5Z_24635 [Micromonospora chokoriensis]